MMGTWASSRALQSSVDRADAANVQHWDNRRGLLAAIVQAQQRADAEARLTMALSYATGHASATIRTFPGRTL